jgi:hypothetical protein
LLLEFFLGEQSCFSKFVQLSNLIDPIRHRFSVQRPSGGGIAAGISAAGLVDGALPNREAFCISCNPASNV